MKNLTHTLLGALSALTLATGAQAQAWPNKPVRAPPDGYTLIVNSVGPIAVNPTLYPKLSYNPLTDLVPIVQIADVPNVLVVHPSVPAKTFDEFLAYAKANPGKLNCSSTGIGTSSHLSCFLLSKRANFEAVHVPYKGADALRDLIAGRVQFMFATIPSVKQHIDAGSLRAIAVSSAKRSRSMPDVPTVAERGFPGFEAGSWFGFFAPKGVPPEVVATLNKAVNEIIDQPAAPTRPAARRSSLVPSCSASSRSGARWSRSQARRRSELERGPASVAAPPAAVGPRATRPGAGAAAGRGGRRGAGGRHARSGGRRRGLHRARRLHLARRHRPVHQARGAG
jgi:tripartite-type tricarboxylate transporter receptor subunit TctC